MQVDSSQDQTDGKAQQGVLIASSLAHRTRQSYLALIRHSSQVDHFNAHSCTFVVFMPSFQVHPLPQAPIVDIMSRIISAPAYGQVPMSHASVPIGW